jgi:hypothetical protein
MKIPPPMARIKMMRSRMTSMSVRPAQSSAR